MDVMLKVPCFNNFEDLLDSSAGRYEEFLFFNNDDHSTVMVFFNGAVGEDQKKHGYAFQRWTWAGKFRHPVLIISDPSTYGESGLALGWYVGKKEKSYLQEALNMAVNSIKKKFPNSKIVSFGSSAGGFAALSGLHMGFFNKAIVVNPQTDIKKYQSPNSIAKFVSSYGGEGYKLKSEDDPRVSLLAMNSMALITGAEVVYIQNKYDIAHYEYHMKPYINYLKTNVNEIKIKEFLFLDERLGHNPPSLEGLVEIAGKELSCFLI